MQITLVILAKEVTVHTGRGR